MRNTYPGPCYRCGKLVEPGAGYFEKITAKQRALFAEHLPPGKWLHQHAACCSKHRGTDHHFAIADEVLVERRRQFDLQVEIDKQVRQETALDLAWGLGWEGSNPQSAIRFLKRKGVRI